jgi:hypothetical protein
VESVITDFIHEIIRLHKSAQKLRQIQQKIDVYNAVKQTAQIIKIGIGKGIAWCFEVEKDHSSDADRQYQQF